ncbi:piggyBac transposable element-derived protein 4-like [Schistocerca piceifrons]|uniref:piggyBac transposable element-derived protein 4-like n=1 Tax=Schistocerca piceifrons TaxID=274613 RepID=UPI001F5F3CB5|nr:piggyBac transposable element-derived protein 4-like [Schistocerca piceifrons]
MKLEVMKVMMETVTTNNLELIISMEETDSSGQQHPAYVEEPLKPTSLLQFTFLAYVMQLDSLYIIQLFVIMFRRGLSDAEIADLINHSDTLDNVESDSDDSECNGVFEEDEIDDSLSSDEDENDVEGVASNPAAVPYPKDSEWTAVDTYRPLPVNTTPRQILVDIDESSSVLDCSKVFLTDSDVNELKRQTNLYASQTIQKKRRGNNLKPHSVLSSWKPVTISEMRRFLGIIFHMCVSKKPKIADHWSTNPVLSCNFCPHVMSRLRFTQILSCLHLVDNSNQKKPGEDGFHPLYKVLPYYNNLKERCIQAYRPSEKVTIDEGICPFRGRVSFRVYMQNKPHKYGLKVYAVAEASSGYVVNFEVYAGKHIVDNSSSAVILRLLSDSSLLNKGHTVYLDRFYSSPELFQQLAEKGTGAVGTVNKSRKGLPKDLVSATLKKGEMSFRRKDNVLAMKWKDKRDVYTLSTRHQATFGTHTKRNGSVVLKPLQVLDYNLNKIGVDIGDQRLQYNPFQHRTVKWWRKLYFHLLLMGVSNAFWLYNAVHRKKITITDFITVLAVQLVEDDTLEFIPRNEGTVGRLTKRHFLQHIPATTKKYAARVCHVCSSRSKKQSGKASRKETRYECNGCNDNWNKLRDAYIQAKHRRATKSGQAAKSLSKWKFEDEMAFMNPTLVTRKTRANAEDSSNNEDYDGTLEETGLCPIDETGSQVASSESSQVQSTKKRSTKKCSPYNGGGHRQSHC